MKKGFTLVELLVVVAIVGILTVLFISVFGGKGRMSKTETVQGQLVRKVEYNLGESGTQFRLEVKLTSGKVDTFVNQDYWYDDYYSSGTVQANTEIGKWYEFDLRGERNERWSYYRQLRASPRPIQAPFQPGDVVNGEIDY